MKPTEKESTKKVWNAPTLEIETVRDTKGGPFLAPPKGESGLYHT